MNKYILLILVCLFSFPALGNDDADASNFTRELMVVGKMSGACGIFKLQIEFQENTGLEGGSKFIERFWITEAARLGMSLEQYATQCHETLKKYSAFSDAFPIE